MKKSSVRQTEEGIYNILIISLVIGLIITSIAVYWFRVNVYGQDESFSELYFSNPDSLPNLVKIGKDYQYDFEIKSDENKTMSYQYSTEIELYNLYNFTEMRHNCLSKYRDKIFFDWTNETGDFTLIDVLRRFEEFDNLIVFPDYERMIKWDKYTLELGFSPPIGQGQFVIFFRNETDIKYYIILDGYTNKTFFNGKETYKGIDLKENNNNLKIIARDNTINVFLNNELIIAEIYSDLYNGQFGFESQDGYYTIQRFKVYKDTPIVIPDDDIIQEYELNINLIMRKRSELNQLTSRSVRFSRANEPWNETIDCDKESFYCEYFDLPNDIFFFLPLTSITRAVEKVPVMENGVNYVLSPSDKESSTINWSDFTISFSHDQLHPGDMGHMILKFDDKWGIIITRNNSYFMQALDNGTHIAEIRNPSKLNQTEDFVDVSVSFDYITLFINNETVFKKESPKNYTGGYLELYMKNQLVSMSTIEINNLDKDCNNPYNFKFCKLELETFYFSARAQSNVEQECFIPDYNEYAEEDSSIDILKNLNIVKKQELIGTPISNPFIPDKKVVFNSPTTRVEHSDNFSMDYGYQILDGARVMEIGIQDFNGTENLAMYVLEKEGKILVYDGKRTNTIYRYINQSKGHSLRLKLVNGDAFFYLDSNEIYKIRRVGVYSGDFFLGSRNTYSEIGNVHFNIGEENIRKAVSVTEDPCELKLVEKIVNIDNILLKPNSIYKTTKRFNIGQDFDYGKVSVKLYGSTGTNETNPLEIHFWVMRDDS